MERGAGERETGHQDQDDHDDRAGVEIPVLRGGAGAEDQKTQRLQGAEGNEERAQAHDRLEEHGPDPGGGEEAEEQRAGVEVVPLDVDPLTEQLGDDDVAARTSLHGLVMTQRQHDVHDVKQCENR
jgi:hypothetical protein